MGLAVVDHEALPYATTPLGRASPHALSASERGDGAKTAAIGHSQTGSQCYWAPEVSIRRRQLRYDLADLQRTDWFSLGLVVWQIITNNEYYSACRALHCREAARDSKVADDVGGGGGGYDDGLDEVQRRSLESGTDDDRKCHEIFLMLANSDPYRVTEPMGDILGPYVAKHAPDLVQLLHALLSKDPARRTSFVWPLSVPSPSSSSSSSSPSPSPSSSTVPSPLSSPPSSSMLSSLQSFISSAASPPATAVLSTPTAVSPTPTAAPAQTAPTPPDIVPRSARKSGRRKSLCPTQSGGGGGGGGVDAETERSENGDDPEGAEQSKKTQSSLLLLKRARVR